MSMSEEQLQKTGILRVMLNKADNDEEDLSIKEKIEMFYDRLDYINLDKERIEKIKMLCDQILECDDEKAQEYLFKGVVNLLKD